MDNFDLINFEGDGNLPSSGNPELEKPIPFDDSDPEPNSGPVSRQPLSLGGGSTNPAPRPVAPKPKPAMSAAPVAPKPKPAAPAPAPTRPATTQPGPVSGVSGQIRGVKTFFTKLHPGAIVFLDEQIQGWLNDHPEITIKRTNITVGEVQSKKTEPNLIVMVWY